MLTKEKKSFFEKYAWPLLALLVVGQTALAVSSFRSVDDLTSDELIVNVDFCSQYYWADAARKFMDQDERMWGYDPWFMAGYPLDFVFNSALPVQLAAVSFPDVPLGRVIKVCFLASFTLVPLVFFLSMRSFGLEKGVSLATAALGTACFWAGENAFFGHMGMISGATLLYFFVLPLALLSRFLKMKDPGSFAFLFFAMPLAFTLHKTAFVLVAPVAVMWVVLNAGRLRPIHWAMLFGVFVFTLLVNAHWLYPFYKFLPLKIEDASTTFFQNNDPLRIVKDIAPVPSLQPYYGLPLARLVIVFLGTVGLLSIKNRNDGLRLDIIVAIIFFGVLSYLGSFSETLRHLQPYRYVTAFYYMWLVAAGFGIGHIARKAHAVRAGDEMVKGGLIVLIALIMVLPSFRFFSVVAPLRAGLDRDSKEIVKWVKENTSDSARLMMEDINAWSGGSPPLYGGARLVQLMPILTDREMIGGPLPNAFIKHHYAGFHDGLFLDRPISSFSDEELTDAFNVYNIGWVLCWSEESVKRMADYEKAKHVELPGGVAAYTIDRKHSFFLEGDGQVDAELGRVRLSGLITESGNVVVSYHWVDDLRSDPPAELYRVDAGDDPVGLIGIKDPPPELVISLRH